MYLIFKYIMQSSSSLEADQRACFFFAIVNLFLGSADVVLYVTFFLLLYHLLRPTPSYIFMQDARRVATRESQSTTDKSYSHCIVDNLVSIVRYQITISENLLLTYATFPLNTNSVDISFHYSTIISDQRTRHR